MNIALTPLTVIPSQAARPTLPASPAPASASVITQAVTSAQKTSNTETVNSSVAALQQITQSLQDTYAVSDKKFTIFKDANGQYITRYISLRDGSVTYVPTDPAVVRSPAAEIADAHVAITA
jgi:ABC-type Zn2+ transport system substrate-binding protein/surface adhesin